MSRLLVQVCLTPPCDVESFSTRDSFSAQTHSTTNCLLYLVFLKIILHLILIFLQHSLDFKLQRCTIRTAIINKSHLPFCYLKYCLLLYQNHTAVNLASDLVKKMYQTK